MATIIEAPGNLISNLTNEREVAQRKLDECIKKKELVELHTHLLGMGSADFWVNNIMKTYLPRVCQPIYDQDDEEKVTMLLNHLKTLMKDMLVMSRTEPNLTEYLGQKPNNADDMSCECLEQHEIDWTLFPTAGEGYIDVFLPHYTYDVVFDWKSLCQIFHVDIKDADLKKREEIPFQRMMTNLESKLGKHGLIKGYIIFNARKRRFESVYGITNSNLINIIQDEKSGQSPLAYVRNAFAMLNRNGEAPDEPDLDTYRGNFTPAFYPHRFQFKDCIYQQRLEVLSILLYDVCLHYAKAGVNYIEFSMGVGDMLNVDIWKHLNDAFPSEFLKWHPDKGNNSGNDGKPKPPTAGRVEQNRKRKITEDTGKLFSTKTVPQ
ncbi:hypothetical protein EDD86DRAFT_215964 [Gorgonomyces haynaldii]|nr:hypothetical protein EDD86DRAFT_215964 [Gorgonomyces haynaldii]